MPYAAGPPPSVHPSTIACFARPVATGQGAGLVRDAVPVHLHPSIQRRAAGAAPTGHTGSAAAQAGRYTRACVLDRRHGETTGGRIQSMRAAGTHCTLVQAQAKARGPRAVHGVSSERRLLAAGRPGPHRPRRGARAVGTSGRAAPSLVQAKGRGDVARPAVPASNAYACRLRRPVARPRAAPALAPRDPPKQRFQVAAAGGQRRQCSPKPQRPACSRTVLHEKDAPAPVPACCY